MLSRIRGRPGGSLEMFSSGRLATEKLFKGFSKMFYQHFSRRKFSNPTQHSKVPAAPAAAGGGGLRQSHEKAAAAAYSRSGGDGRGELLTLAADPKGSGKKSDYPQELLQLASHLYWALWGVLQVRQA